MKNMKRNCEIVAFCSYILGAIFYYLGRAANEGSGEMLVCSVIMFLTVLGCCFVWKKLWRNNRGGAWNDYTCFIMKWASICLLITSVVPATIGFYTSDNNVSYARKLSMPSDIEKAAVVRFVYGGDEVIQINETYQNCPVTVIGRGAFARRSKMKAVVLPSQLKEIKWRAFEKCTGLKKIELPYGLTTIGKGAFSGCSGLTQITIPPSVTNIPRNVFSGCNKGLVILGEPGSAAQAYAEKYLFTFEPYSYTDKDAA